jgi:hypothetical protein
MTTTPDENMEIIEKIWNTIEKVFIQPWLAFAVATICLLVMSPALDWIGFGFLRLNIIRDTYGHWIGLVGVSMFVLGTVGTIYKVCATRKKEKLIQQVKDRRKEKEALKAHQVEEQAQQAVEQAKLAEQKVELERLKKEAKVLAHLHTPTTSEADPLLSAVKESRRTAYCGYPEVSNALVAKGLVEQVPTEKTRMMLVGSHLIIPDFVWEAITQQDFRAVLEARVTKAK